MTTLKNLENIEYQAFEDFRISQVPGNTNYLFFFRNKETNEYGITPPDFSNRTIETYSKKYLETHIFGVFDETTIGYFCDKQMYIQTSLNKKSLADVKKGLKKLYAQEKPVIKSLNDVAFSIYMNEEGLFSCDVVEGFNMNVELKDSVRFNEYCFIMSLCGFVFEKDRFICTDKAEDFDSIASMLKRVGAKTIRDNRKTDKKITIDVSVSY